LSRRLRSSITSFSRVKRIGAVSRRSLRFISAVVAGVATVGWLWGFGLQALGIGLVPLIGLLFLFFWVGFLHGIDRIAPVLLLLVLGLSMLAGFSIDFLTGAAGFDVGFTQWSYAKVIAAVLSVAGVYTTGYLFGSSSGYVAKPLEAEVKASNEVKGEVKPREVKAEVKAPEKKEVKAPEVKPSEVKAEKVKGVKIPEVLPFPSVFKALGIQKPRRERGEKREPLI